LSWVVIIFANAMDPTRVLTDNDSGHKIRNGGAVCPSMAVVFNPSQ
jgi:hypothetical protein